MTPLLALWPSADTKMAAMKADVLLGTPAYGCGGLYRKILCGEMSDAQLSEKISESYRGLITLTMADTTLHMVGILPLYDKDAPAKLRLMTEACAKCSDKLSLHIIALRSGIARVLGVTSDDPAHTDNDTIRLLDEFSAGCPFSYTYTIMDDYADNGAPLGFTLNSFSEYLALFFSALIRDYHSVLAPSLLTAARSNNIAIGVASLRFDRESACRHLLLKAFLGALDNAGLNSRNVDAQKASDRASQLLLNIGQRYPEFYSTNVIPLYRDYHKSESEIVAALPTAMDEELNRIEKEITSVLHDPDISYPEKEGILALILGRDNQRLDGVQYDRETSLLDDACSVPVNLYINAFNRDADAAGVLPLRGDFEKLKKYVRNDDNELAESPENSQAFDPLPEIKKLKLEILNTTAFIRRKNDELYDITHADRQREEAENDALHPGRIPSQRNLPEIHEQPLEETYRPAATLKVKQSVDLRPFFSPVRDQKELGACTSFAVVSMYEAIMNRHSGSAPSANLSERFLYYHSNILTGRPEGGSNYFDQLGVLGKYGTCREDLYGYSTDSLDTPPSRQATEDAMTHRVLKALQIPLRTDGDKADCIKENHRLLTSALSEGYPVGISLKIYDNFGKKGAFINRPDENDISTGGEGNHAMVLAGYSETEKCYIVRNSWGEHFGHKGYCYISASYIDDPEYNPFSCIITDTTDSSTDVRADIPAVVAGFAGTETQIKIAAIRNVLDESHVILESRRKMYDELYRYYQLLMQRLGMPQVRNRIRKAAEEASQRRFNEISEERQRLNDSFVSELKEFKHRYIKISLKITILAMLLDFVAVYFFWPPFSETYSWIAAVISTIIAEGLWLNYSWSIRSKRRALNERLADLAQAEERARTDMQEKQLQFHVAGMWIDGFHRLVLNIGKTYDRLISFNGNLKGWYEEDSHSLSNPAVHEGSMFIYLEDRHLLDICFETNRETIISNINLMDTFDRYAVDSETIQEARERLKESTLSAIRPLFADFRMARFLTGTTYPYLRPVKLDTEIGRLISVGRPSVRHSATDPIAPSRLVFIDMDPPEAQMWERTAVQYFSYRPALLESNDPCSCDLVTVQLIPVTSIR